MSNNKLKNNENKEQATKPFFTTNKKILAMILALVVFFTASLFIVDGFAPANPKIYHRFILSAFSGDFDGEHTPNSYYEVKPNKDENTGENYYSCVNIKFSTTNSVKFKEIWVNLSDINANELTIFTSKGYAGNTIFLSERTYSRSQIKANKDGWFRIYNNQAGIEYNVPSFYGELKVGFSANVKFREIVIVDVTNKLASSIKVDSCSYGRKPTSDKTEEHVKFTDPLAKNVVDEQSSFVI